MGEQGFGAYGSPRSITVAARGAGVCSRPGAGPVRSSGACAACERGGRALEGLGWGGCGAAVTSMMLVRGKRAYAGLFRSHQQQTDQQAAPGERQSPAIRLVPEADGVMARSHGHADEAAA